MTMVTANSCSSRPMMPPMKTTGMNTAASDTVMDRMVKAISAEPLKRRLAGLLALLDMADDIFQHDDGVVDDEADRQGQRHQRQIVEAVAQERHGREGADHRDGQRQRRE